MVIAIMFIAFWIVLFLPVVLLPFLPKVDTAHAPALSEFVRRAPQPLSDVRQDHAA